MTLEELLAARKAKLAEAEEILAGEELTDEQRAQVDRLMDEADGLQAEIEKVKADEERATRLESLKGEVEPRLTPASTPGTSGLVIPDTAEIRLTIPHGRLYAFRGPHAEREAYYAGQWLRAQVLPADGPADLAALRAEAREWCKEKGLEFRAAQSGQTNTYGGATIADGFRQTIIDLVEQYGVARQYTDKWPMTSDTLFVPKKDSGVTMYFVGDTDATSESRLAFSGVSLTARELSALVRVPISLAQDSVIDFADRVARDMANATAAKEDDCLFNGDGTSTYGGIVGIRTKMVDGNHAASYNDATAGDDQWGEYELSDLNALVGKTPDYEGEQNERWFCSKVAYAQTLVRLMSAQGGSTGTELSNGFQKQFLGYDVVTSPKMPSASTAIDEEVVFLFGDMSWAVAMGVRNDFAVRQSDQRYFEYRQIGILCSERFDIVVHSIGDSSNAGPLVGLRGNTS